METLPSANGEPHFAETMGRGNMETLTSANGMVDLPFRIYTYSLGEGPVQVEHGELPFRK